MVATVREARLRSGARMRRVVLGLAFLIAGQTAIRGLAQPTAATPPPGVSQANDDTARGLYQAGKAAYEAGNFKEALGFFEQAYQHSPRPGFLFNIGQVADRLRQDDKAITAFKAYLDQVPRADNRAEVQQRLSALEEAKRQREAAAAAPAAPTTTRAPAPASAPSPTTVAASASSAPNDAALTHPEPQDETPPGKPVTKQWWFWTGLGAVVVGGAAVALAVALGGGSAGQPAPFQGSARAVRGP